MGLDWLRSLAAAVIDVLQKFLPRRCPIPWQPDVLAYEGTRATSPFVDDCVRQPLTDAASTAIAPAPCPSAACSSLLTNRLAGTVASSPSR